MKKIGQVTLDDSCYCGQDLYTDGAVEDEMLDIAKSFAPRQFPGVIAERKSWPILYHFSHVRENILNWIPFTGTEKVLEIGSGCGAVTGALLSGAAEVTCIDLSMKRSEINAWRHRDAENLTIHVGNFQDIEKTLTEKYDYITLIGVFEYGAAYIDSENPYVDFLKIIKKHLQPDGQIILAIENRFGLKYWAGCTEDHCGRLFEGLEGYPAVRGVKTFTKKELLAVIQEAGLTAGSWYYPFPDYKFPDVIHSDRRLPRRGELHQEEYNFDRLRMKLFQESAVYDSLLENGMYPEFANSFLVILGQEAWEPRTVYVKFSNERDARFCLRTEIRKSAGETWVAKLAENSAAETHVNNIRAVGEKLEKAYAPEGLFVNRCMPENGAARLEFLEGETLEERLDALVEKGRCDEAESLLFDYLGRIERIHGSQDFVKTPEFVQVFGEVSLPEGLKSGEVSDIDLIPANLVFCREKAAASESGTMRKMPGEEGQPDSGTAEKRELQSDGGTLEKWELQSDGALESAWVIDYEWTFEFPIPAHFLMYRMIHYYLESDGKRHELKERGWYERAGISETELTAYAQMEENFQKYMIGTHIPMRCLYDAISPGKLDVMEYYQRIRGCGDERKLQVFFDRGGDFTEQDSFKYPMDRRGISIDIPVPTGTTRMRLDPGEAPGGFRVEKIRWKGMGRAAFHTNGFALGDNRFYFGAGDPQLILENVPKEAQVLTLELAALKEQEAQKDFWSCFAAAESEKDARMLQLENELKLREEKIRQMENTRAWKLYRRLKPETKETDGKKPERKAPKEKGRKKTES